MFDPLGRFLLIISAGIWLGSILTLGYAVAPETFRFSEDWNLNAEQPGTLVQVYGRTVAGNLTSSHISNVGNIQFWSLMAGTMGVFLLWFPKRNRNMLLLSKTVLLFVMALGFMYSEFFVGQEMIKMLNSPMADFHNPNPSQEILEFRKTFDRLHDKFTRASSISAFGGLTLLIVIAFRPFEHLGRDLTPKNYIEE